MLHTLNYPCREYLNEVDLLRLADILRKEPRISTLQLVELCFYFAGLFVITQHLWYTFAAVHMYAHLSNLLITVPF